MSSRRSPGRRLCCQSLAPALSLARLPVAVLWVALLAALLLRPGDARAQIQTMQTGGNNEEPPAAAVMPFGAAQYQVAERLNLACERALAKIAGLKVLGVAQWVKEAKDSGQGDDLEAMARRLGADVLVTGTLAEAGPVWRLSIDVFSDKAVPIGALTIDSLTQDLGPAAIFKLEQGLARLIKPAVGLNAPPPPESPEDEPAPQTTDRERATHLPEVESIRQNAPPPKAWVRPPWRPFIEAGAGLVTVGRTLTCGPTDPRRRNQPCQGAEFPLSAGAGIRLDAAIYPFALQKSHPAPLAGLGLGLLLEVPFWPNIQQQNGSSFPIQEVRFEAGPRWRWNVANATLRPILEAGLSYGYHEFTLSGGTSQPPYPDLVYQYLLPQIGLGSYLTPRLHMHAEASLLGVLSAGPFTAPASSSNPNPFGTGKALGFRVGAETELFPVRWLSLRLGGMVERINIALDGQGCSKLAVTMAGCDLLGMPGGATLPGPITGAQDLYLEFWLMVGYRY